MFDVLTAAVVPAVTTLCVTVEAKIGGGTYVSYGGSCLVEVVDDDTDEQVHDEVRPDQHEEHKKPNPDQVLVSDWLHVLLRRVDRRVHHRRPGLRGGNFEEG